MSVLTALLLTLCAPAVLSLHVLIDPSTVIATTSDAFASFSIDMTSIVGYQRPFVRLNDPLLQQLAANLATQGSTYIRIGGSLQDQVVYNVTGEFSEPLPTPADFPQLYLNASNWDDLIAFCAAANLRLVFGLNAKLGRQSTQPPTWNSSNAAQLLKYAAAHNQSLPVVELGNESNVFNCSGVCANLSAPQLATQVQTLRETILDVLAPGTQLWAPDPSITGDAKGQCWSWYGTDVLGFPRDSIPLLAPYVTAVTWHYYSQFQGQNDSSAALILSPEYQHRVEMYTSAMDAIIAAAAPGAMKVMGETASYWGGGLANVSNRFASGFWYLNQLGYLASRNYSVHIRQDLIGGFYGLLDSVVAPNNTVVGYSTNPDYYTHALWKQLIGTQVLSAVVVEGGFNTTGLRAWAFLHATAPNTVVAVISNFNSAPVSLDIDVGNGAPVAGREVFMLTSDALDSAVVYLNNQLLELTASNQLPPMQGAAVPATGTITWPALSYGFVTVTMTPPPAV